MNLISKAFVDKSKTNPDAINISTCNHSFFSISIGDGDRDLESEIDKIVESSDNIVQFNGE